MEKDGRELTEADLEEYRKIISEEAMNFNMTEQQRRDILDDIPFLLYQKDKLYNPEKGSLRNFRKIVCRNFILQFFRTEKKRYCHESIDFNYDLQDSSFDTGYEDLTSILNPYEKKIVDGCILYNYTFADLAKHFGLYTMKIYRTYHEALEKIKDHVTDNN